jgi:hypothetical protein
MKFEQRTAGKAKRMLTACLGTPAMPRRHLMPHRSPLLLALLALLALPVTAGAADPLLSGYAGPGSGEQVILGGQTVGGGGGGGGTSGGAGASADQGLRASPSAGAGAPAAGSSATSPRKPQGKQPSSSSSKQKTSSGSSTSSASSGAAPAQSAGAPPVVAYPTRAGEVGGLPLSLGEALLGLAALALLVLAGLGLRRLTDRPQDPPSMPQVPVR